MAEQLRDNASQGAAEAVPPLPRPLVIYIAMIALGGVAWLAYLVPRAEWGLSTVGELGLFFLLIVVAGSFPLPVGPKVKTDVTTAVLFAAVLLLEPRVAALTAVVGIVTYTLLIRFWGERLRLPWYKYPFNAGATAFYVGLAAVVFDALSPEGGLMTPAVVAAAAVSYGVNTALVVVAVTLQLGVNPLRFWWMGTRENGLAELSLLAFGFLGAVAYQESPWTVLALVLPVAVIYIAFSRLARTSAQLAEALERLKALQGRIVNAAKLASIGGMSVDMAHQTKNPLTILLGRLEMLSDRIKARSPARRDLDIAISAGWRIQELTQTFTSMGQQRWVELDLYKLIDEGFGFAGLRSSTRVETRYERHQELPRVAGNPVLLREAFFNVFFNAIEAMEDGGLITINASPSNGTVVVRISDDGPGIPREMMGHLFEPFHSTKPHGSGLGLFATKHILEMHQGSIEMESQEQEGTTVTIRLPAVPAEAQGIDGAPPEGSDIPLLVR